MTLRRLDTTEGQISQLGACGRAHRDRPPSNHNSLFFIWRAWLRSSWTRTFASTRPSPGAVVRSPVLLCMTIENRCALPIQKCSARVSRYQAPYGSDQGD